MRSAPERFWALVGAALLLTLPATAVAQGRLAEARAAFDAAEFEAALSGLDALDAADDLSFEDVCGLLALRAEVHLALGDEAAMEADLLGLVAIAPDAALPRTAPPGAAGSPGARATARDRASDGARRAPSDRDGRADPRRSGRG